MQSACADGVAFAGLTGFALDVAEAGIAIVSASIVPPSTNISFRSMFYLLMRQPVPFLPLYVTGGSHPTVFAVFSGCKSAFESGSRFAAPVRRPDHTGTTPGQPLRGLVERTS